MVTKENAPAKANSLLQTATSKRVGRGRFASLIKRGTAKPPVKKVKIPRSDESRVSDITGSVFEERQPTTVKEVQVRDVEVESSVLGMSMNSNDSETFSVAKAFTGKAIQLNNVGKALKMTPQPPAFKSTPKKDAKPASKKSMEIQPGLRFSAPSPMSLDRIQVQMGQEHTAPESDEYKAQQEEAQKQKEEEEKRQEHNKSKKEAKKKLKAELAKQDGEGFEAQLGDFQTDVVPSKKKSLVKKLLGKIRPKSPKKKQMDSTKAGPTQATSQGNASEGVHSMSAEEALSLARQAMEASKRKAAEAKPVIEPPAPNVTLPPSQIPVTEITTEAKEDSISDLESTAKKNFPVNEILMNEAKQGRDDESVSTLGIHHVLERPSAFHPANVNKELRDPTPTSELEAMAREGNTAGPPDPTVPRNTLALIDQIDSGSAGGTEAAAQTLGRCGPAPQSGGAANESNKPGTHPVGYAIAAALCMATPAQGSIKEDMGEAVKAPSIVQEEGIEQELASPRSKNADPPGVVSPKAKFTSALDAAIDNVKAQMNMAGQGDIDDNQEKTGAKEPWEVDIHKALSPIEECDDFSPVQSPNKSRMDSVADTCDSQSMPDLENMEGETPRARAGRARKVQGETPVHAAERHVSPSAGVIDLTGMESPPATGPNATGNGKEKTGPQAFSFDDFMDIAASKLGLKEQDDRYAIEGEDSPRHVVVGEPVDDDDGSVPVVRGVEMKGKKKQRSANQSTPKASGAHKARRNKNGKAVGADLLSVGSAESSFEVYEHPDGDVVMWSDTASQARGDDVASPKSPKSKGFPGYFADGLFDLLSTDESVNRGRKNVPFLANQLSCVGPGNAQVADDDADAGARGLVLDYSDRICGTGKALTPSHLPNAQDDEDGSEDEDSLESAQDPPTVSEALDPGVGVMCGAVPLYFMYAMQNNKPEIKKSQATSPRKQKRKQRKEVVEVEDITPQQSEATEDPIEVTEDQAPVEIKKKEKSRETKEDKIEVQQDNVQYKDSEEDAIRIPDNHSQKQAGRLPVASPNPYEQDPDISPEPVPTKSGHKNRKERPTPESARGPPSDKGSRSSSHGKSSQGKGKVLLEKDDAYWDTLSTIASLTKDRSAEGERPTPGVRSMPGPIPVEITTKTKGETDNLEIIEITPELEARAESLSDPEPDNAEAGQKAGETTKPTSHETAATPVKPRDAPTRKQAGSTPKMASSMSNSGSSSDSKVAGLIARFEQARALPTTGHGVPNIAGDKSDKLQDNETDSLLLAITRSEGGDDTALSKPTLESPATLSATTTPRSTKEGKRREANLPPVPTKSRDSPGRTGAGLTPKSTASQPDSGSREVPRSSTGSTPDKDRGKKGATNWKTGFGRNFQSPSMVSKNGGGIVSNSSSANSLKQSQRSVSWGYEEIYEAPEQTVSPEPSEDHDENLVTSAFSEEGLNAARSMELSKRSKSKPDASSFPAESPGSTGIASLGSTPKASDPEFAQSEAARLSLDEEQELISRTLLLSKQLLASISGQDPRASEGENVKSLMSFGTEDSTAKSSLPDVMNGKAKVQRKPTANPVNESHSPSVAAQSERSTTPRANLVGQIQQYLNMAQSESLANSVSVPTDSATASKSVPLELAQPIINLMQSSSPSQPTNETVNSGQATKPEEQTQANSTAASKSIFLELAQPIINLAQSSATSQPTNETVALEPDTKPDEITTNVPKEGDASQPIILSDFDHMEATQNESAGVVPGTVGFGHDDAGTLNTDGQAMSLGALTDTAASIDNHMAQVPVSVSVTRGLATPTSRRPLGQLPSVEELRRSIKEDVVDASRSGSFSRKSSAMQNFVSGQPSASSSSGLEVQLGEEHNTIAQTSSGLSEESPIDVDGLLAKYDNLAHHIIGENDHLKAKAMRTANDGQDPTMMKSPTQSSVSSVSLPAASKLDQLRLQRAQALAKLQGKSNASGGDLQSRSRVQGARTRDHLSNYAGGSVAASQYSMGTSNRALSTGRATLSERQSTLESRRARSVERVRLAGSSSLASTTSYEKLESASTSSDSVTPSMKARELRRQLDEALQASRDIRKSQEQLGTELQSFKSRFHRKNDALEDQALRAMGGDL